MNVPITTWMQTGDTYGSGIVSGSSTSKTSGTEVFSVADGDYYVYVSTGSSSPSDFSKWIKVNGSVVTTSVVTNGSLYALKTNSKISVSADVTINVRMVNSDLK